MFNKNNLIVYLFFGIFLIYYGLQDIKNFIWLYDGIALGLGITCLIFAGIEYKKKVDQESKD